MRIFQPGFSFWPQPRFLGNSKDGFGAWMGHRDALAEHRREELRLDAVKQIVEAHHDRNARTIGPSR